MRTFIFLLIFFFVIKVGYDILYELFFNNRK